MVKICSKCRIEKSIDLFNKKSKSKDGHSSKCKECNKLYLKEHYIKNKSDYYVRNEKKKEKLKEWFCEYKKRLECLNCGEDRYWVLDFHHRNPKEKEGHIGTLLLSYGKNKALKEIKKCDVLCANCHRDIHYKMGNNK